ncbi:hypothetical protein ANCDUO_05055 [Ancylostoma duodenale]|uniref:Peptidase A2 domain-containing protein n=1 Tax=Ancylostoma duodenale TaxID=51022 RepID=A0A0C2DPN6_9BILA|nr:hypothetical protein ANCDUO_05055 [Ancylostoma duodenale]
MRQKTRRRSYRSKKSQCKKVVTFAAENARTHLDVTTRGHSLRFQLNTGADITLISRRTWKKLGCPTLETCNMPVNTADGTPMNIDGRFSTECSVIDHARDRQDDSRKWNLLRHRKHESAWTGVVHSTSRVQGVERQVLLPNGNAE